MIKSESKYMYDIKAKITLTGRDFVVTGYRPAHLIGDYLTTGVHNYICDETLFKGKTIEGYISFISPEYYPNSLECGMIISFQEGSKITGYAEVIEIYNHILNKKDIKQCDECESEFYVGSSNMKSLCPECANKLYGYPGCEHIMVNGRCTKCYWNGNESIYLKNMKS